MSNSGSSLPPGEIDKESLYGKFQQTADWQDNLSKKLAHKSLDIAETDMDIDARRYGMGWKELLAVGALFVGGVLASQALTSKETVEPPPVAEFVDTDTHVEWEFKFGDLPAP